MHDSPDQSWIFFYPSIKGNMHSLLGVNPGISSGSTTYGLSVGSQPSWRLTCQSVVWRRRAQRPPSSRWGVLGFFNVILSRLFCCLHVPSQSCSLVKNLRMSSVAAFSLKGFCTRWCSLTFPLRNVAKVTRYLVTSNLRLLIQTHWKSWRQISEVTSWVYAVIPFRHAAPHSGTCAVYYSSQQTYPIQTQPLFGLLNKSWKRPGSLKRRASVSNLQHSRMQKHAPVLSSNVPSNSGRWFLQCWNRT